MTYTLIYKHCQKTLLLIFGSLSLLILASPIWEEPVWGEFWKCQKTHSQAPLFTDSPTVSAESKCQLLVLDRAAFNKVPAQAFVPPIITQSPKEPVLHQTGKHQKTLPLYTSWNAKEIHQHRRKKRFTGTEIVCEVSGSAHGEKDGPAVIRITRGALIIDTVKIFVHKNYRPVRWKTVMKGECRNPLVEIHLTRT